MQLTHLNHHNTAAIALIPKTQQSLTKNQKPNAIYTN